jgi:hypothetical protein
MKEGLEGVVEFLLPELAFAGEQGKFTLIAGHLGGSSLTEPTQD